MMPKRVEVVDRVQVAHTKLLEGFSCTAVVAYLAEAHAKLKDWIDSGKTKEALKSWSALASPMLTRDFSLSVGRRYLGDAETHGSKGLAKRLLQG